MGLLQCHLWLTQRHRPWQQCRGSLACFTSHVLLDYSCWSNFQFGPKGTKQRTADGGHTMYFGVPRPTGRIGFLRMISFTSVHSRRTLRCQGTHWASVATGHVSPNSLDASMNEDALARFCGVFNFASPNQVLSSGREPEASPAVTRYQAHICAHQPLSWSAEQKGVWGLLECTFSAYRI